MVIETLIFGSIFLCFLSMFIWVLKFFIIKDWMHLKRLREDCATAYQILGAESDLKLDFEHPDIQRALDNLIAAASLNPRPHNDLLPWPKDDKTN